MNKWITVPLRYAQTVIKFFNQNELERTILAPKKTPVETDKSCEILVV